MRTWLSTEPRSTWSPRRRRLDGLRESDAEAPGRAGVLGEDRSPRVRLLGRAGDDAAAERLDEPAPIRLLIIDPDHVDVDLEAEERARERQRRAPLARTCLGDEASHALLLVVVRLWDRGIRLVRAGRGDAFVLVVDARRRS